jgi:iron(III) transport system substrate-binding protein
MTKLTYLIALTMATLQSPLATAQEKVLNLYSARHYSTDEALYNNFTKATGIKINRIDADDAGILVRLKAEGASSPADVILLVDAARLWRADEDGLFQSIKTKLLDANIPANYRSKPTPAGHTWFGFSSRARVVVYNKARVNPLDVDTYEKLAMSSNNGKLCVRSGSHPYNLSLFGSVIEKMGDKAGEAWLAGLVANMARSPQGGDTDQIKAVGSGECGFALANTYYLARLMRSNKPEDIALVERVRVVFPNQETTGTHMNISGGAVAKFAPNKNNAVKFLEYLASKEAQDYFAKGNNEWPTARGVKVTNPALIAMSGQVGGVFKAESVPLSSIAKNQVKVQQMLDRVGFK